MMRLDRFLSVARIFKSRSLAAEAIASSMVYIDNLPAKAAKEVRPGQIIIIDTPRFYKKIKLLSLPCKNMSKGEASSLYNILEERIKD
jgi:ribosome-associated heat shock protein Hsp15